MPLQTLNNILTGKIVFSDHFFSCCFLIRRFVEVKREIVVVFPLLDIICYVTTPRMSRDFI